MKRKVKNIKMNDLHNTIHSLGDNELMMLMALVKDEMSERDITLDVGDLGEKLAIQYFNSTPRLPNLIEAPKGAKNVDALSRDGERYSIKSVLKAKKTGTVYPDVKNPDKQLFENMLIVCLNSEYQLDAIYCFTWDAFLKARAWDKRMNAWYLPVSSKRLQYGKKLYSKD